MENLLFEDLKLSREMKHAIRDMGFEEATPIQSLALPHILEGKDVIGQAQTGTGKTAAFGIPVLERLDTSNRSVQAVILCPTRELAIQVAEEIKKLSKYQKTSVLPVYGGQPIERQIKALKRGVQIIIGTPGRVMDHIHRRTLKMDQVKMIILDEADEMLDMGFREDIEFVLEKIPDQRQMLLFSATMSPIILGLTRKYQNNPEMLKVTHQELTVPEIRQVYFEVREQMKLDLLTRLIDMHNLKLALVFCNTKRRVDRLVSHLQTRGYFADGLHGDMSQNQRDRVMAKFRKGQIEILVATDVAARGIDVDDVEAVFNYDVPNNEEYYVHRIGRTGRAGKTGQAFTFVSGKEIYQLRDIQRYTKVRIEQKKIPSLHEVEEVKRDLFMEQLKKEMNTSDLQKEIHLVERLMEEDYSSLEIAAALLKLYNGSKDDALQISGSDFKDTGAQPGMVRFFINVGRKQKIKAKDIVKAIREVSGLSSTSIGRIDVLDKFSFVELPEKNALEISEALKRKGIKGLRVNLEPAHKKM
ncbi:MAG: DEAD/DEAH box helicase [Euryarchaeota archaeon]|jgi:ATP-dependent RNA helicase DeaD|nr:DEAD/DEAH box helicase [Euryarchaeota archaeon]HHT19614.1 DEAD/DEAH box helicase [Methanobacterium sp.]